MASKSQPTDDDELSDKRPTAHLTEVVEEATDFLGAVEASETNAGIDDAPPERIAELAAALKGLEDAAENIRGTVEDELDTHVKVGESCGPLTRIQQSRRYVEASTDEVKAAMEDAGLDPFSVMKVSASNLGDIAVDDNTLSEDRLIGTYEVNFYRRG